MATGLLHAARFADSRVCRPTLRRVHIRLVRPRLLTCAGAQSWYPETGGKRLALVTRALVDEHIEWDARAPKLSDVEQRAFDEAASREEPLPEAAPAKPAKLSAAPPRRQGDKKAKGAATQDARRGAGGPGQRKGSVSAGPTGRGGVPSKAASGGPGGKEGAVEPSPKSAAGGPASAAATPSGDDAAAARPAAAGGPAPSAGGDTTSAPTPSRSNRERPRLGPGGAGRMLGKAMIDSTAQERRSKASSSGDWRRGAGQQ